MLLHKIKHTLAFIMIDAWMTCTKQAYIDRVWRGHSIWYDRTVKIPLYWPGLPGFYETNRAVSLLGNGWRIYTFLCHIRKQMQQGACVQTGFFPAATWNPWAMFSQWSSTRTTYAMSMWSPETQSIHALWKLPHNSCCFNTNGTK